MLCLGNICRSPLAEGILREKISKNHFVDSAGTINMHQGKKADARSIAVAKSHGVDINIHRSRPITKNDLDEFDIIFCMDQHNYDDAISMAKSEAQKQKISLILEDYGDGNILEVPDPYYSDLQDFEEVYLLLDKACDRIAKTINQDQ